MPNKQPVPVIDVHQALDIWLRKLSEMSRIVEMARPPHVLRLSKMGEISSPLHVLLLMMVLYGCSGQCDGRDFCPCVNKHRPASDEVMEAVTVQISPQHRQSSSRHRYHRPLIIPAFRPSHLISPDI